jgi:cob(I)alamin adenosyltransferase
MKIYTKTGDAGQTGLFGGPRIRKDDIRIEAYGTVDELNAFVGLARCEPLPPEIDAALLQVQNDLFAVGAELATPQPDQRGTALIGDLQIAALELAIDHLEEQLPPLTAFILPGGAKSASTLHVARGVCRRAERRVVTLAATPEVADLSRIIRYLNRLSDYLFVAARAANQEAGGVELPWQKPSKTP